MQLTEFEYIILDKIIPTQTLGEPLTIKTVIRRLIEDQRENLVSNGEVNDSGFKAFQSKTTENIWGFLHKNEFLGEREGGVFFLTEKGKQLRQQKSLQNYIDWREEQRVVNADVMRRTREQGFLEEKQTSVKVEQVERKSNRVGIIIASVIILVVIAVLLHKYGIF
jgi:hypothetical protein